MLSWLVISIQRRRWPITYKLLLAFGLLLALFVLNSALMLLLQFQNTGLEEAQAAKYNQVQALVDLRRLLKSQNDLYTNALFVSDKTSLVNDNYGGDISDRLRQLNAARSQFGPAGATFLTTFDNSYRQVLVAVGTLNNRLDSGQLGAARQNWPQVSATFNQAATDLDKLYNSQLLQLQNLNQQRRDLLSFSQLLIVAFSVGGLLLGLLLAFLFSRCIGRPIAQIQYCLDQVARGDLSQPVQVENQDELGRLAQILNVAVANLRQVLSGVRISELLQELAQNLSSNSSQQASSSTEQLGASTQIIRAMEELTRRAQQISVNALNVATSSEQTAHRMADLQKVANQANQMVCDVRQAVQETISQVREVNQTINRLSGELAQLTGHTQEINGVVGIISNITEEVHLLSLNASIEAAGAGQFGDRFRVVAGEVKNLARRTSKSAGQVTKLIQLVQDASQDATAKAQQSCQVAEGVVVCNERLETIVTAMNSVVAQTVEVADEVFEVAHRADLQVEEIRQAIHEQMNASLQVNTALQHIGQMAQENVTSSQLIANSTHQLDYIAAQLVQTLSGITLA